MKIVEKVIKTIVNILTGVVLLAILVLLYGKISMKITGHNYSNYFGYTLFKVTTGSMGNAVKIDDVVIVKIKSDIKENDIITYYDNNSFITHRVKKIGNTFITARGDANNTDDAPITKNQVIGKVVHVIKGLGIWQKVLSTPKILFSIFITLLLFDCAFSYRSKKEKDPDFKLSNTQVLNINKLFTKEYKKEEKEISTNTVEKEIASEEISTSIVEKDNVSDETKLLPIEEIEKAKDIIETDNLQKTVLIPVEEIKEEIAEKVSNEEDVELLKTQAIPIEDIELLKTQVIPVDEIELLKTQVMPIKEIKKKAKNKKVELLETQVIPVEEIKKQEIL